MARRETFILRLFPQSKTIPNMDAPISVSLRSIQSGNEIVFAGIEELSAFLLEHIKKSDIQKESSIKSIIQSGNQPNKSS
jgi:hypothetical protein